MKFYFEKTSSYSMPTLILITCTRLLVMAFYIERPFFEDLHEDRLSPVLLKAVALSSSSHVSTGDAASSSLVSNWVEDNDAYVMSNIETLSIDNL